MNKIFSNNTSTTPLTEAEILAWYNKVYAELYPDTKPLESYDMNRISGQLCNCSNGGNFVLSTIDSEEVQEGGKHYMTCKTCGCSSHL